MFRKSPEKKAQDLMNDPEASRYYMQLLRRKFISDTPWSNVSDYKIHFIDKGWGEVEHKDIKSKRQLENFIEDDLKANLQKGELYTGIVGDADWIGDSKIYSNRRIRKNIRDLLKRCGPGSMRILIKGAEKFDTSFVNAEKLENLGVNVRVRNKDTNVRAAIVGPKDEQTEPEYLAGVVWRSYGKEKGQKRVVGEPQEEGEMIYNGFTMKWEGEKERPEFVYLDALKDYSNKLWLESVTTVDELIAERETSEYVNNIINNSR